MRVLLVGAGGREHALAWKLAQSPQVSRLDWAPGNGGTEGLANPVDIPPGDVERLTAYAAESGTSLVVVGPEVPLAKGLADSLEEKGILCFGPSRSATLLEASKVYCKEFCTRHGVPTGDFKVFDDPAAAQDWLTRYRGDYPLVLKADGLAAGKGVLICENEKEARDGIRRIMVDKDFGDAGDWLLIEQFLRGEEASVLAFTDGHRAVLMPPARDYKRAQDGDRGLNTGGMGAYSPSSHIDAAMLERIRSTIIHPVLDGIRREGAPYRGVIYAGLMLTDKGPQLLEINCRFGDPETQVVVPRLYSDLFPILLGCARGDLGRTEIKWADVMAVTVVLASGGYPGAYKKGLEIEGLEDAARQEGVIVFHAGTRREGDKVLTAGGRVLNVTALASSLDTARKRAYEAAGRIRFEGMQLRTDIALNA